MENVRNAFFADVPHPVSLTPYIQRRLDDGDLTEVPDPTPAAPAPDPTTAAPAPEPHHGEG